MKILATSDLHRGFSMKTHIIHDRFAAELAKLDWDVLVLAGDLASHRPHQFQGVLRWARELAGTRPVLCVRGNHDLWDCVQGRVFSHDLSKILDEHQRWFSEYGVHHLGSRPYRYCEATTRDPGVTFVGWDGWWGHPFSPPDLWRMPAQANGIPLGTFLAHKAGSDFGDAHLFAEFAKIEGDPVIAITHFPIAPTANQDIHYGGTPRYWELLQPHIDVLIYGHTHKKVDEVIEGVRVVNAGSDYDEPAYALIEVPSP